MSFITHWHGGAVKKRPLKDQECSFCGKKKDEVSLIIATPDTSICEGCVAICVEILEDKMTLNWREIINARYEPPKESPDGTPAANPVP